MPQSPHSFAPYLLRSSHVYSEHQPWHHPLTLSTWTAAKRCTRSGDGITLSTSSTSRHKLTYRTAPAASGFGRM